MKITAIRSDRIYRDMMTALPDKKENIYRNQLMKPFEFKWACVGIPLTAAREGGYDVVCRHNERLLCPGTDHGGTPGRN